VYQGLKKRLGNLDDFIVLTLNFLTLLSWGELHIDFDVRAISIHVSTLANGGHAAFRREDLEQITPTHSRFDSLHFSQAGGDPASMLRIVRRRFRGWCLTDSQTRKKKSEQDKHGVAHDFNVQRFEVRSFRDAGTFTWGSSPFRLLNFPLCIRRHVQMIS
jgi:hypothetical protein